MNDKISWKQQFRNWIISWLEDLWSALWRSLLLTPVVVLVFYLFGPDPTPGLGSGMAILGVMLLVVLLFFGVTFLYFRVQSRQEQNQSWWGAIGWSVLDLALLFAAVVVIPTGFSLITVFLPL